MILDVSVENFRSIKEVQTLSFEADNNRHLDEYYVAEVGGYRVLKMVPILGANASGKSNVLRIFPLLRQLVLSPRNSKNEPIEYDKFALDTAWKNRDTVISINIICDEKKYYYCVVLNNTLIRSEQLRCQPFGAKKDHLVFERTTDEASLVSAIKWGEKYTSAEARKLLVNLTHNVTVFGSFQRSNVDLAWMKAIIDWFADYLMPNVSPNTNLTEYTTRKIDSAVIDKAQVVALLNKADVGVDGLVIEKEKKKLPKSLVEIFFNDEDVPDEMKDELRSNPTTDSYKVSLSHCGVTMDFDEESKGTQRYYGLASILLQLIHENHFVAIDEMESRLHPDLYTHFVNTYLMNAKNSQLVFTTHNREFLNDKTQFRDDAVYLTEKSDTGATELYSLIDFDSSSLRNTTNRFNAYKAGILGGVPRLGDTYISAEPNLANDGQED